MIVITGSAGFIGSCVLGKFNAEGITDIMLVDDFEREDKQPNYLNKTFSIKINRAEFINWFRQDASMVQYVIHMGARTDTTEFNTKIFDELNFNYTKSLWEICAQNNIPFIYASSAATYGMGEHGYDDNTDPSALRPLNPYGESKNEFDKWALVQKKSPPKWYGLKFFNVYGPNEYHKARMASVIFHAFNQINATGKVKLFRSHHADYKDGEQLRDFVYVKDVCDVIWFLYSGKASNGIYNLGSGKARTFNDLVKATFSALNKPANIEYIDTPLDIRDKYQYFTEARMNKLLSQGYSKKFHTLEEGVADYVKNYLVPKRYF
jgi:ADP-L-glycero-D-manno-heptose 6-epimerase